MTDRERLLDELRPAAFVIAYRMLGSVSEAEDVVQEALLRVHQAPDAGEQIASPRAFAATVTTWLAINELRSARARRERYAGEMNSGALTPSPHAAVRGRPLGGTRLLIRKDHKPRPRPGGLSSRVGVSQPGCYRG
jgi:RNA polymerase sigma factor (sigma-70 family)